MAGIRPSDNAATAAAPESTEEANVPYLFSVRNMFFSGKRVWPVLTPRGQFWNRNWPNFIPGMNWLTRPPAAYLSKLRSNGKWPRAHNT